MNYREYVKSYEDFPKDGVLFWDFSYLLKNVGARNSAVGEMKRFLSDKKVDKIAAIESKGFTLGSILAHELQKPLILIRKPGLIPDQTYSEEFVKEYGTGEYQIKADAIEQGERVAIIYDIMAGSGASLAAVELVHNCGGVVAALAYVTELEYLKGRDDLADYEIFSLVKVKNRD
jgi:adenine phosphoribosyltransferase